MGDTWGQFFMCKLLVSGEVWRRKFDKMWLYSGACDHFEEALVKFSPTKSNENYACCQAPTAATMVLMNTDIYPCAGLACHPPSAVKLHSIMSLLPVAWGIWVTAWESLQVACRTGARAKGEANKHTRAGGAKFCGRKRGSERREEGALVVVRGASKEATIMHFAFSSLGSKWPHPVSLRSIYLQLCMINQGYTHLSSSNFDIDFGVW